MLYYFHHVTSSAHYLSTKYKPRYTNAKSMSEMKMLLILQTVVVRVEYRESLEIANRFSNTMEGDVIIDLGFSLLG